MHWIRKALKAYHDRQLDKLKQRWWAEMMLRGGVIR